MKIIKPNNLPTPPATRQSGAALIIGLVLLIAMTIIGIGALTTTSLEYRMAGNMGDKNLAFNAAETAGRAMQRIINTQHIAPIVEPNCNNTTTSDNSLCIVRKQAGSWWQNMGHSDWASNTTEISESIAHVDSQPRVLVEQLRVDPAGEGGGGDLVMGFDPSLGGTVYYRITSRGTGRSDSSQAIVQQVVAKEFTN